MKVFEGHFGIICVDHPVSEQDNHQWYSLSMSNNCHILLGLDNKNKVTMNSIFNLIRIICIILLGHNIRFNFDNIFDWSK